ncbi:protein-arginine deiminase family protein [Patulibacter defluvii]|uniref:protein-arginine deiminase family protein n=1 Tax=Patulibacter defluvii TaxID=3095358 RepID=UPI002A764EDA|nr:protein-arginine deiminase family protein [Patulibacter sp. DM4]
MPAALLLALAAPPGAAAAPIAALRGDADRDGRIDVAGDRDLAAQRTGTVAAGVLVLPNVDDDSGRCAAELAKIVEKPFTPVAAAACRDGADDVVNGDRDALDLAELRVLPWADAPGDASGSVRITSGQQHARLFRRDGGRWSPAAELSAADLRAGVVLGLEATAIAGDGGWDGRIEVALEVRAGGQAASDQLAAHVAPVLLVPQTAPARTLFANAPESRRQIDAYHRESRAQVGRTIKFLKTTKRKDVPNFLRRYHRDPESYRAVGLRQASNTRSLSLAARTFDRRLKAAVAAVGLGRQLVTDADTWAFAQDQFEPAYAAVPGPDGSRVMRVALRSTGFADERAADLTRHGDSAWLLRTLRGADSGVVLGGSAKSPWEMDGGLEATPPVPGAPHGKVLVSGSEAARAATVITAQGAQPAITVDTGWLQVGHVDELFAFVPAATARGWALVAADPAGALRRLRKLSARERRRARVVGSADRYDDQARKLPSPTVAALLRSKVADQSATAARRIDAQLAVLRRELGLTDADVVRVPVLFGIAQDARRQIAWTGNVANGLAPGGRTFLAATPHGPVVGGRDLFADDAAAALKAKGISVRWVDTWPSPHVRQGEVHCFTNALRDLGDGAWWRR